MERAAEPVKSARSAALRNHLYRTLDDSDLQDGARKDPDSVLTGADRLVLDEVQWAPCGLR